MAHGYAVAVVKMSQKTAWGAEIRRLRNEAGFTQAEIAERLGVSQGSVSDWETETNVPETKNLLDLAALLKTDVNHLVAGLSGDYDRLGLTSPVSDASTNGGTKGKGGASDVIPASAQARIRELEQELRDIKAAIRQRALDLAELATDDARLRKSRTTPPGRGRKGGEAR